MRASPTSELAILRRPMPTIGRDPINTRPECGVSTLCYTMVIAGLKFDCGWILIWKTSQSALRPAEGRPEGRFRGCPDQNPVEIRHGSPISGPEALLRNIG